MYDFEKLLIDVNYHLDAKYMRKSASASASLQMAHPVGRSVRIIQQYISAQSLMYIKVLKSFIR